MRKIVVLMMIIFTVVALTPNGVNASADQIITGIELEGNQVVSDEEILAVIGTEVGDLHNEDQLKKDMKAIYELGYFQDVKVAFELYNGGLKAIFELFEYPLIQEVVISGNESLAEEELKELLGVETGEILNHQNLIAGRKRIEEYYRDQGYMWTHITNIDIGEEGVLTMAISETHLNDVIVKGNEKTKDFVILRELNLNKGQVLNVKDIQQGYQKLMRLNFFESVDPRLERVDGDTNKANLIIEITEAKTGNFGGGVTWSSKDGWLGFVNIKERNLLGNAQTLGFNWEFGGVTNYSLNFREPWLMGTPTSFGISIYDRTSDSKDADKGEYEEHRQGGSISFGHQLVGDWDGLARFKVENSTVDWKDALLATEEASVRSLTLQVDRDTTNHPFNPTEGGIDVMSIEYAGQIFGGDADFTKYNLDLRRFYSGFRPTHAWGFRVKAGLGNGTLPELEKYRLGGSETLRGYDSGSFSGNDMLLLNLEYRFPIADNFTGVIFADGGNAWDNNVDIDLGGLHYSMGAGIRMNTPIGQIRLDYGFNEDGGGQPHFSIGNTF